MSAINLVAVGLQGPAGPAGATGAAGEPGPAGGDFDGTFAGTSGIGLTDNSDSGIDIQETGTGAVALGAVGGGVAALYNTDASFQLQSNGSFLFQSPGPNATLFISAANPNGTVVAAEIGDLCITAEPALYQATATGDAGWVAVGTINPTGTAGFSLDDNSANPIAIQQIGTGPLELTAAGGGIIAMLASGIKVSSPSSGFTLYTAADLAGLPDPVTTPPAWGFTYDGNLYFYPFGGSSWAQYGAAFDGAFDGNNGMFIVDNSGNGINFTEYGGGGFSITDQTAFILLNEESSDGTITLEVNGFSWVIQPDGRLQHPAGNSIFALAALADFTSEIGSAGDVGICPNSGNPVFMVNVAGTWEQYAGATGPTGATGATGPTGPTGPAGPTGPFQMSTVICNSTQNVTVPSWAAFAEIVAVAGGYAGAGSASAALTGGVATQVGGPGGPAGTCAQAITAVTPGVVLAVTVGAGGVGTAGGAASSGTTGGTGSNGNPGGITTVIGAGVNVTAPAGGLFTAPSLPNSVASAAGNLPGGSTGLNDELGVGGGGFTTSTYGAQGGNSSGYVGQGGTGGAPASATKGGLGGAAGAFGGFATGGGGYQINTPAGSATSSGTAGGSAAANTGAGGGGGGAGAPGGAGGAGGSGGSGYCVITFRSA